MGHDNVEIFLGGRVTLHAGDCRDALRSLADNSIDSVVTDPPYALVSIVKRFGKPGSAPAKGNEAYQRASAGFMGKQWDTGEVAFSEEFWAEVLRVLKPGGHVVAFSGTRTYHRMAVAIEDAGFEIRDQLGWLYGCLDEASVAVTQHGVMPYHKIKQGDLVLAYDATHMSYQWEPVEEVFAYEISDTVYRISTDYGDQLVSRSHRCIVERGGKETFVFAEEAARQREICVPVLEDLRTLLNAVPGPYERAGCTKQDVFASVRERRALQESGDSGNASRDAQWQDAGDMRGLRGEVLAERQACGASSEASLFAQVQRGASRGGVESARTYGQGELEAGVGDSSSGENDRRVKPGVEGWCDVQESEGQLRLGTVRSVSGGLPADVAGGRLCDGASAERGDGDWSLADANGVRSSHRPQPIEQRIDEPDVVRDESRPQAVRAWRGHKTVVGRITPEHYRGVIWCVRVKSGAFVAVRNGMAFPTGNSGFPKSHNQHDEWEGWGTALKPAWEPIALARKPLDGTVAANLAKWGVGALNIDGCRIESEDAPEGRSRHGGGRMQGSSFQMPDSKSSMPAGRWPANIVHDGSDEVLACFPTSKSTQGKPRGAAPGDGCGMTATGAEYNDSGSAARFFYSAKADAEDRIGSRHPTVKPIALMRYLVRLVTPPGGVVLDPFAGTGTTGAAAFFEGFSAALVEREAEYRDDIRRRMALVMAGPDERKREIAKALGDYTPDAGPLFGGERA